MLEDAAKSRVIRNRGPWTTEEVNGTLGYALHKWDTRLWDTVPGRGKGTYSQCQVQGKWGRAPGWGLESQGGMCCTPPPPS